MDRVQANLRSMVNRELLIVADELNEESQVAIERLVRQQAALIEAKI